MSSVFLFGLVCFCMFPNLLLVLGSSLLLLAGLLRWQNQVAKSLVVWLYHGSILPVLHLLSVFLPKWNWES